MNKRMLIALAAGRGLVTETVRRTDEMLPGVQEKIEQLAPALSELARKLWPGEAAPTPDVGGEALPGVPRVAGLVRVAYARNEGKRSATYRGNADYAAVLAYDLRGLAVLGFEGTVLAATGRAAEHDRLTR